VAVDVRKLLTLHATLTDTDLRSSLGKVDDETGYRWVVAAQTNQAGGTVVPRFHASVDRSLFVPTGHSSVWFRGAAGFSPHDDTNPFANFYFGGFGNNWVDRGDEKRYRDVYSFPGSELNEIAGRTFVKSMLEWNLPPLRFRRAGTPGFYVSWARPALFVGNLVTNPEKGGWHLSGKGASPLFGVRRAVSDAGAQVDFRFGLLSTLDMTVSVGGALAFEDGRAPQREAMLSVKILK
jgi:hypothetical protein